MATTTPPSTRLVTLTAIQNARATITGRVHRTPLLSSRALGERAGTRLYLKAESLQKTGSFKTRGALNKVSRLTREQRARGLVTISAGNHAQALAYAAAAEQVACTVVMPASAPLSKVAASRGYGAKVVLHGDVFEAWEKSQELQRQHGYTFVHPFDDPDIIAGQGTVGLEIIEDLPDADLVVVPVGGGGLIAGIAAAVRALRPQARVIGVEPTGAAAVHAALQAGHPVRLERVDTIADGLAAPATGELALEHIRTLVEEIVLVSDDDITRALTAILERAKLVVEPAGAAAVAALLSGKIQPRAGTRTVAVLSGGNIDLSRLREMLG